MKLSLFHFKGLFLFLFGLTVSFVVQAQGEDPLEKIRMSEPTYSEILATALRLEKLDNGAVIDWQKKIKQAPWLPTLSVGYDRILKENDGLSIADKISVSNDTVTIGPPANDRNQDTSTGNVFRVRATWALDETLFSKSTLSVSQETREISKSRMTFGDYLFKAYNHRRQLLVDYFYFKNNNPSKAKKVREEIIATAEEINAFTGGIYSQRWWTGK